MENKRLLKDLIAIVLEKMSQMDYATSTLKAYRWSYGRLKRFAEERGELYFSEKLGSEFLKSRYQYKGNTLYDSTKLGYIKAQIRSIRVLGDYQIHGFILRRKLGTLAVLTVPESFKAGFDSYKNECKNLGHSEQGMYTRFNRLKHFLFFLNGQGFHNYSDMNAVILSEYVKLFINLSSKTVRTIMVTIRTFLKHLFLYDFITEPLSEKLPAIKNYYAPNLPKTWEPEEIRVVLNTIDRGNSTGKRDYAILLIIARLGLRASDIKTLRLSDIHWQTNILSITQHKTKREVIYPLLNDIGWALIDYLKHGRPNTASPYVFVRHNAPFVEFAPNSAMNRILVKYIREAGVKIKRNVPLGLHSLRHTLASTLLSQDIPLLTISNILGHSNLKSTDIYLHIDTQRLMECAIDPEDVFNHVQE
jgi:integrase